MTQAQMFKMQFDTLGELPNNNAQLLSVHDSTIDPSETYRCDDGSVFTINNPSGAYFETFIVIEEVPTQDFDILYQGIDMEGAIFKDTVRVTVAKDITSDKILPVLETLVGDWIAFQAKANNSSILKFNKILKYEKFNPSI